MRRPVGALDHRRSGVPRCDLFRVALDLELTVNKRALDNILDIQRSPQPSV
jgi:hypothetical protein